jgi:hypothetical protein
MRQGRLANESPHVGLAPPWPEGARRLPTPLRLLREAKDTGQHRASFLPLRAPPRGYVRSGSRTTKNIRSSLPSPSASP